LGSQSLEVCLGRYHLAMPRPGDVDLWVVPTGLSEAEGRCLRERLSVAERRTFDSFVQPIDRNRRVASRIALRSLLGAFGNLSPDAIRFDYSPTGKPCCARLQPLEFNMAHSGGLALIGFTTGGPIGVDIEMHRSDLDFAAIARQVFARSELEQLARVGEAQRGTAFFTLWTRKEAFLKRNGEGFLGTPQAIHVGLGPAFPSGAADVHSAAAPGLLQSFSPAPDYMGAVATTLPMEQTTVRHWCWDAARQR
jgi:4'-phosphopantetheinyl transferase